MVANDPTTTTPIRQIQPIADGYVAVLSGEIDMENSPELRRSLLSLAEEKKPTRLVLDLREVPYMDSSALAVVVELLRAARTWNGKLVLWGPQKRVRGLIEISRLNTILPIVESENAALRL